ncbi:MAG TPA: PVC-type heme-binding CxxCH protein, partial [Gemmataceae bacterium]|nr:PVC-type heme-binding CxxCH protein [Gemmataceae bacterium]
MRRTLPTLIVLAVSTGLFAAMAATAADGKGKPSIPQPDFQVPAGFVVEKVAGPPLVRYPLFAAFDDRGRLFVAEGTGTNLPGEELARRRLGRILVLEDTDGDGRFDTSKVFADQLVFPQGALWHDGALYTASHPSWWRFEDTGAGQAGQREELLRGFKFTGNGCDIHGPFFGPDGRLYWNFGNTGGAVHDKNGKPVVDLAGNVVNNSGKPYRQGMVFRCEMDGSNFEVLGHNFRNNYEVAVDSFGTLWQSDNDDDGNRGVRINYVMEFGNFGFVDENTGAYWQDAWRQAQARGA